MRFVSRPVSEPIKSRLVVPGDKSVSQRAVIFSALARGESQIRNFLFSQDCINTLKAFERVGIRTIIDRASRLVTIESPGRSGFVDQANERELYFGNSGTGVRLSMGALAGVAGVFKFTGDESLSRRPMKRVTGPLERLGAKFEFLGTEGTLPVRMEGGRLSGVELEVPVPSAQVKSALLLASLSAEGRVRLTGRLDSRDHTERIMEYLGIDFVREDGAIEIEGPREVPPAVYDVVGDISSAAFWIAAALITPGSRVRIEEVGLNEWRTGFLEVLREMGARVMVYPRGTRCGEPFGDIEAEYTADLQPVSIVDPKLVPRLIDEIPLLAVLAARAKGRSEIRGAEELRKKESDRIDTISTLLNTLGVDHEQYEDGVSIDGGGRWRGGKIDPVGDHRIAMSAAVAGLGLDRGEMDIINCGCIETSYPEFLQFFPGELRDE